MTPISPIIEAILNTLMIGETLYTTDKGTQYKYLGTNLHHDAIKYQVNKNIKYIPFETLSKANVVYNSGQPINRRWYRHHNRHELSKAPSNIYIIRSLLNRVHSVSEFALS